MTVSFSRRGLLHEISSYFQHLILIRVALYSKFETPINGFKQLYLLETGTPFELLCELSLLVTFR